MPTFFDENLAPSVTQETDAALVSLGQRGFDYVDTTAAVVGNYASIQIIASGTSTFTALSALNSTVGALGTTVALTAGTIIYGPFTGFTLASNSKVIAYKAG
jgi:hypothetical protein